MDFLGFGLALLGFLIAAGVWFRSVRQAEAAAEAQDHLAKQLTRSEVERKKIQAEAAAVSERAAELEKQLAEAVARRDEKAMAGVMWELELERSYRQWRDVIVPGTGEKSTGEVNAGQQLAFAISQEVERLREEVGVSIRFDGRLDLSLEPEVALGALRIAEELLALAAKRADEVSVAVDAEDGPTMSIALDCAGWLMGDDPAATQLAEAVERMAKRLEGTVVWDRQADDRLIIFVSLPAPAPDELVANGNGASGNGVGAPA